MSNVLKKGVPVFREFVRRAFTLGSAFQGLGIELHLVCRECKGEVSFQEETVVKDGGTISLPKNPADGKGLKVVCVCTEREVWGE